jgi:hypothetical protein
MSDNLSFTLGRHGYEAFKYVPYGAVVPLFLLEADFVW